MTEAIEFIERFIRDEAIYWKLRYSTMDEQEYIRALEVYASYFGADLKPLRRGLNVDEEWIAEYAENTAGVRPRKLFMIKQFMKEGRTIYQDF